MVKYLKTENFLVSIKHQSNTNRVRQKVMIKNQGIFNRSNITFDRSKLWKTGFFGKQQKFYAENIQSKEFHG